MDAARAKSPPLFIERPGMTGGDVLHEIARPVIAFLTKHPEGWWMDKHDHAPKSYHWRCACCTAKQSIKRKKLVEGHKHGFCLEEHAGQCCGERHGGSAVVEAMDG